MSLNNSDARVYQSAKKVITDVGEVPSVIELEDKVRKSRRSGRCGGCSHDNLFSHS